MDEIEEQISLYEAIIEVNYEYWITENELTKDVDIEDFRLQVDMRYRETLRYQTFPVGDADIEARTVCYRMKSAMKSEKS